jgi:hypothetical protein
VTKDAFIAAELKRFDEADTNHDGKVTREEMRASRHEHHGWGRGHWRGRWMTGAMTAGMTGTITSTIMTKTAPPPPPPAAPNPPKRVDTEGGTASSTLDKGPHGAPNDA